MQTKYNFGSSIQKRFKNAQIELYLSIHNMKIDRISDIQVDFL